MPSVQSVVNGSTQVIARLGPKGVTMRLICPIHGAQSVVQISLDLWSNQRKTAPCDLVQVIYEFEGERVESFLLSAEFAKVHGVNGGTYPLPDDYPDWITKVSHVCKKCFNEK